MIYNGKRSTSRFVHATIEAPRAGQPRTLRPAPEGRGELHRPAAEGRQPRLPRHAVEPASASPHPRHPARPSCATQPPGRGAHALEQVAEFARDRREEPRRSAGRAGDGRRADRGRADAPARPPHAARRLRRGRRGEHLADVRLRAARRRRGRAGARGAHARAARARAGLARALLVEKALLAAGCSLVLGLRDARRHRRFVGARLGPRRAVAAGARGRRRWRSRRSASRSARSCARCARRRCWRFLLSLPLAFLALVPARRGRGGLYDADPRDLVRVPLQGGAEALDAAVNRSSPGLGVSLVAPAGAARASSSAVARARRACGASQVARQAPLWGVYPRRRWPSPRRACAGCARRPRCAGSCARPSCAPAQLVLPLFVAGRRRSSADVRCAEPIAAMPGVERLRSGRGRDRGRAAASSGIGGGAAVRDPRREGRRGLGRVGRGGRRPARVRAIKAALPGAAGDHRRVPVRVHRATATAACYANADGPRSTTTRRSSCSRAPRSATPAPAPTSSRRGT